MRSGKDRMKTLSPLQLRGPCVTYNEGNGITRPWKQSWNFSAHVSKQWFELAPSGHEGQLCTGTESICHEFSDLCNPWCRTVSSAVTQRSHGHHVQSRLQSSSKAVKESSESTQEASLQSPEDKPTEKTKCKCHVSGHCSSPDKQLPQSKGDEKGPQQDSGDMGMVPLGRQEQGDHHKYEASLVYIESFRPSRMITNACL